MAKLCDDDVNILTIKPISIKPESAHGSGSLHIYTIQEENGATANSEALLFNYPVYYHVEIPGNNHRAKSKEMDHKDCSILMSVKEECLHSDNKISVGVPATEIHIKQENHNDTKTVEMGYDVCDVSQLINHSGEKPHTCPQCNKSFTAAGSLKRHLIIHSGEKPHACPLCNKRFTQANHLKRHMMNHFGAKPHVCPQCNKNFIQASTMRIHMRTHSGEKPYRCPQCNKSFSHASSIKKHMAIHTRENPHPCPQCNEIYPCQCP